ncbi:MAG TPA: TPM domain-containing protein, partial [Allosphingosinicella sp.]|nr:TPM domain-containing protein [Allosphingosinicella sp.]
YGYRLGRAWGIGQSKANNGTILIVAPKERKVRIEVGYGLEPILTDALTSLIIQNAILPRFKQGDMAGGIMAGADAVIDQLQAPPEEAERNVRAATGARAQRGASSGPAIFPLIFWGVVLLFVVLSLVGRHSRQGGYRAHRYGGGGGAWPIVLWTLANELERGARGGRSGGGFDWGGGGGFSGGGGSFGGGGASGSW